MTTQLNITTSKPANGAAAILLSVLLLIAASAPAVAHGGFDHVMGTVVKVGNNVLTVKTAKGDVDVKLDEHTELTKNDQKAQLADLKPGTRVIVDLPHGGPDKPAHSVKIGVTAKTAPAHAPTAHK